MTGQNTQHLHAGLYLLQRVPVCQVLAGGGEALWLCFVLVTMVTMVTVAHHAAYLGHSLYTAPPPTTSEYALYDTILWKLVAISLSLPSIIRWGHMARSCPGLASGTQCCGRILRTHQKLVVKKGKNAECPRRMWLGCPELSC